MAQHLDSSTLILSHIDSNYYQQLAWQKITEEIVACEEADTPLQEKIWLWYCMGGNMHSIGKMIVAAIYDMPTTGTIIKELERQGYSLIDELQEAIQPLRLQYQQLTNKDLDDYYYGDTAAMGQG